MVLDITEHNGNEVIDFHDEDDAYEKYDDYDGNVDDSDNFGVHWQWRC